MSLIQRIWIWYVAFLSGYIINQLPNYTFCSPARRFTQNKNAAVWPIPSFMTSINWTQRMSLTYQMRSFQLAMFVELPKFLIYFFVSCEFSRTARACIHKRRCEWHEMWRQNKAICRKTIRAWEIGDDWTFRFVSAIAAVLFAIFAIVGSVWLCFIYILRKYISFYICHWMCELFIASKIASKHFYENCDFPCWHRYNTRI